MKKTILSMILLAAGCFTASAQEETKEVFNPHWYIQAQGGFQQTLGEIDWCHLNSANVQIGAGYKFTPVWGLRLTVGGWQSKGGIKQFDQEYKYKWNYVAPTLDVTFDLTNAIWGYKASRVVSWGVFAGIGANIGWNNDEAADVKQVVCGDYDQVTYMHYLWDGTKARFAGQFGTNIDFNISRRVALGIEANWNLLSDHYNSKKAGNVDWYFNTLAGVKVNLGKVSRTETVKQPEPQIVERIIEKVKHDTIYVTNDAKSVKREKIRRDIFYPICKSQVGASEMPKVEDIVAYLNKYPEAKVTVTGYADKGTGNPKVNIEYARSRAQVVANMLTEKFGIDKSRITVDSKGDTVQPYEQNDLNRVSICIAE